MANSSRYQEKKRQGLVPAYHNPSAEQYRRGAWKNWPERLQPQPGDSKGALRFKEEERSVMAHRESTKHTFNSHCHTFIG